MQADFQPLFGPGLHQVEESQLSTLFVERFQERGRREHLLEGLSRFIGLLKRYIEGRIEIWINGSFSTYKEYPNDIDIAVFIDNTNFHTPDKNEILKLVFDPTDCKVRFNCDLQIYGHGNDDERWTARGLFGFDRNDNPKGIPFIIIN